jgi:hypothetical protein
MLTKPQPAAASAGPPGLPASESDQGTLPGRVCGMEPSGVSWLSLAGMLRLRADEIEARKLGAGPSLVVLLRDAGEALERR